MPSYTPLFGTYTLRNDRSGLPRSFFRLARRQRKIRELLDTTIGAAAGAAALLATKRITHSTTDLGGKRTVATVNELNRNSTAADVTNLKGMFSTDSKIATPTNKAGNFDV